MNQEDEFWKNYDICYECRGCGDDYYWDENTATLVCNCFDCPYKPSKEDDDEFIRKEDFTEDLRY